MSVESSTRMYSEAAEASEVVQKQLDRNASTVARIGRKLQQIKPGFIITVARGKKRRGIRDCAGQCGKLPPR